MLPIYKGYIRDTKLESIIIQSSLTHSPLLWERVRGKHKKLNTMKKIFSFVSAILLAGTMCAQTITIDGDNADWAEVPMLTEPGVGPVVKMVVPQDGITLAEGTAFALMVEGDHELILAGYPVIFTDADKSTTTGGAAWYCPSFGKDYELATWDEGSLFGPLEEMNVREMSINQAAFTGVPFTGSVSAFVAFDWGNYMIPATPTMDAWMWSETQYHPFNVAAYSYADLANTHTAAATYSTHRALLPGETLPLSKSGNDTAFWASWAVELTQAAIYNVSIDVNATNMTSIDLYLVDVATNEIVATKVGEDISAPAGQTVYGTWDLSNVPAGKYMLKVMNHVQYSDLDFTSVTLSVEGQTTGLENTLVETTSKKVVENGQIYIIRGNERYNVLGTSVR